MIVARQQAGNAAPRPRRIVQPRPDIESVDVAVSARLHLGFVDLHGGLGRRFGSIGIALEAPATRLSASRSDGASVHGPDAARAADHVERLVKRHGLEGRFEIGIEAAIPAHVGLGSGTQMSLAVGAAVSEFHGLHLTARDIAGFLDRGARSSIGIATFEQGGFIVDGGRGEADAPPPVISRMPVPEDWRFLLIFDQGQAGLHGEAEIEAFRRLPLFPAEQSAHLCRVMLMSALPALAEREFARFSAAVAEVQGMIGDHFAPVQGGRYMSRSVSEVLSWLDAQGIAGIGQSSWGPTGFAIIESAAAAATVLEQARRKWPAETGLAFMVTRARNSGARVSATARPR
jgi:beta-RFAP synthase